MKRLDAASVPLEGIHLVEASAGTGKTHAITSLYLRAVVELGLLPDKILVVTFTRAATAELRERVRSRLRKARTILREVQIAFERGEELLPTDGCLLEVARLPKTVQLALDRLDSSLLLIDEAAVLTIHGFCARVLEGNAFESRMALSVQLLDSTEELVEEIIVDFSISKLSTTNVVKLPCLLRRGLDFSGLRQLAQLALSAPNALILPESRPTSATWEEAVANVEASRSEAIAWLIDARHESDLAGLQKTKGKGLGSRLLGYVEKARDWLLRTIAELDEPCEAFDKIRELADKNSKHLTVELVRFIALLDRCDQAYGAYDAVVGSVALELRREFIETLKRELETRKESRRIQSYEDLLSRLRGALSGEGGSILAATLRAKFPLALIDEFQDTDPTQYEVFSRIYAETACLFMIGDPKQSIYAFRGADVDNYLRAANVVGDRRHTLDVNYRSDPSLVSALDRLFGEHPDPFCGAGIDFVRVKPRADAVDRFTEGAAQSGLVLGWFEDPSVDEGDDAMPKYQARSLSLKATVQYTKRLLSARSLTGSRIRPSDIAVLTRTNRQCTLVAKALGRANVRCVVTSDGSVFESEAASSLVHLLRALCRPSDLRSLTTLLLDPLMGVRPEALDALTSDESAFDTWSERLTRYQRIWNRSGVLSMLLRLFDELSVTERMLAYAGGERAVTNWIHVAELIQVAATRERLGPEGQLRWLERARVDEEHCSQEERQLRVESDAEAVLVTTIHRSKGLQYPFVVCPFLWDERGSLRKPSAVLYRSKAVNDVAGSRQVLHLQPELLDDDGPELQNMQREQLAESARLMYVALTRAKHHATCLVGPVKGVQRTAIGQLLFQRDEGNVNTNAGARFDALEQALKNDVIRVERFVGFDREQPGLTETDATRVTLHEPTPIRRIVVPSVHTTSYSALTVQAGAERSGEVVHATSTIVGGLGPDVGRDIDAIAAAPLPLALMDVNAQLPVMPRDADEMLRQAGFDGLPFAGMPNGPRTGEALHALFENMDFETFDEGSREPDISGVLQRYGVGAVADERALRRALSGVLDVELVADHAELKLRHVKAGQRLMELEFMLDLPDLNVDKLSSLLSPEVTGMPAEYTEQLVRLGFEPVSGYLRGFIDLVFVQGGRYYVADYKSNFLGKNAKDYLGESLRSAMMAHHYPVQAALYAVAVDRWLQTTVEGYEYEQHFGGVLYLFLRGMHPCLGPGAGVFFHRPDVRAMRRWDAGLRARVI